jgi:hypothetical protein
MNWKYGGTFKTIGRNFYETFMDGSVGGEKTNHNTTASTHLMRSKVPLFKQQLVWV